MPKKYGHTSKNYLNVKEEYYYNQEYKKFKQQEILDSRTGENETPGCSLLDSSLISRTKLKNYTHKILEFGNYIQVYEFNDIKHKKDNNLIKMKDKKYDIEQISLKELKNLNYYDNESYVGKTLNYIKNNKKEIINQNNKKQSTKLKKIELKNINRSKFQLERIIKANEHEFKSFITLTFADDIKDISDANKKFGNWCRTIKRIAKDFKYVCIPEFQKNERVHYHLLTNIHYDDKYLINENLLQELLYHKLSINKYKFYKNKVNRVEKLIFLKINDFPICYRKINDKLENTKKTYNFKSKQTKIFKTIRYWNKGFSNVISIKDINVVGYMSKYMTKDIDNRLWGKRRYLYSQNLTTPTTLYLDLETADIKDFLMYYGNIKDYELKYDNVYSDKLGQAICFKEFKKE